MNEVRKKIKQKNILIVDKFSQFNINVRWPLFLWTQFFLLLLNSVRRDIFSNTESHSLKYKTNRKKIVDFSIVAAISTPTNNRKFLILACICLNSCDTDLNFNKLLSQKIEDDTQIYGNHFNTTRADSSLERS